MAPKGKEQKGRKFVQLEKLPQTGVPITHGNPKTLNEK